MNYINQSKIVVFLLVIALLLFSCKEDVLPKPKAQLRLEYQNPSYKLTKSDCAYQFEYSSEAIAKTNQECWMNIEYPKLNATINLTYRPIEKNLKELFIEAEKLTFNHVIKADGISPPLPYSNSAKKIYGAIYKVTGNAASPIQFHITDSIKNFITGAVYFNIRPNYDSIIPAIDYLHNDIVHLVESLEWKE